MDGLVFADCFAAGDGADAAAGFWGEDGAVHGLSGSR
jgi:hypothetical protein